MPRRCDHGARGWVGASLVAGLVAWAAVLAGGATRALAQSDWDKVVAEAKKEGKVVVYNGTNFRIVRKLADLFQKEYGITVEVRDATWKEMRKLIHAEQAAGRAVGDVDYTGAAIAGLMAAEGAFQLHGPLPLAKTLAEPFTANGTFLPSSGGNLALLVNTNLVKEEIKSWKDLQDPKWAGKIYSYDPRVVGAGQIWFEVTYRTLGGDFHQKIAAHKPFLDRTFPETNRRYVRTFPIYLPFNVWEYQSLKDLPIKVVIPQEGVPIVPFGTSLLKGAPHPNAGRLFMNFLLDPSPQLLVAMEGFRPAAKDTGPRVPEELRPLALAKAMGTIEPGKTQVYLELAREIYK